MIVSEACACAGRLGGGRDSHDQDGFHRPQPRQGGARQGRARLQGLNTHLVVTRDAHVCMSTLGTQAQYFVARAHWPLAQ
jgi:hypothetical protein